MREKVLDEIRRIAAENDGKAPGCQAFERETGISMHAWYGIHFARWGDAIIEAGLAPNEMQGKLDHDAILLKIAGAWRHFGRIPTYAELRIYGRTHPGYPAHSTISNQMPASVLVPAMGHWLNVNPEFADLVPMLPALETHLCQGRSKPSKMVRCTSSSQANFSRLEEATTLSAA